MSNKQSSLPSGSLPAVLGEKAAAEFLAESPQLRRIRRYEDQKRLERGEPIEGPTWFRDGPRIIKYRVIDLIAYVEQIQTADNTQQA